MRKLDLALPYALLFTLGIISYASYKDEYTRREIVRRLTAEPLKITLLVVLPSGSSIEDSQRAIDSSTCYSNIHGYNFVITDDLKFKDVCRQKDKFFRRHCIAAQFLVKCDYLLFLDADIGVVNPKRRVEEFIDDRFDVTFYDRFFNAEIMAGSYLLKNSAKALDFVLGFANYENHQPNSFHGTDNGALHAYVLSKLYPDRVEDYQICLEIYKNATNFEDLFVYEACIRSFLGLAEEYKGCRFLRKGTGWARDSWLTNSMWNPENGFMIHCWKTKELRKYNESDLPIKLTIENRYTWYDPIVGQFDLDKCVPGNTTWNYDLNLIVSAVDRQKFMDSYKKTGQIQNFEHLTKLLDKL